MMQKAYINLYLYGTDRLHAGTGVYQTFDMAVKTAMHKRNYVMTCEIQFPSGKFKPNLTGGWTKR